MHSVPLDHFKPTDSKTQLEDTGQPGPEALFLTEIDSVSMIRLTVP